MRRSSVLVCLLLLLLGPAAADEEPAQAPKPLTEEQIADKVLEAVKAEDQAALQALAKKDDPDPWLVADLLCYRGRIDAAESFAKAAPRVDTEKLPAYVEAWRKRVPDKQERELIAAMNAAMAARQPERVLAETARLPSALGTVIRVRLRNVRGFALEVLGRWDEAHGALREAADAAHALGWLARASTLYEWAGDSADRGQSWANALASWERYLALARRRGDKHGAAGALVGIGIAHKRLGNYTKALSIYEQALAEKRALGDKAGEAGMLVNIGNVLRRVASYADALAYLERGRELALEVGQRQWAANALKSIGSVHLDLGHRARALSTFEQAMAEYKALGDEAGATGALGSIGIVHYQLGDFTKALSIFEQTLVEERAHGDKAGAAKALGNIANAHSSLGDHAKALSAYEQALAEKRALGDRQSAAVTLSNIGSIHADLGDHAKALSIYEQALAEHKAVGDRRHEASLFSRIGDAHWSLGEYGKARRSFERSASAARSLRAKPVFLGAQWSLALLELQTGRPARALGAAQKALDAMEDLLGGLGEEQGAAAREKYTSLFAVGALAAVREKNAAEALTFLESGRAGALLDALDKRERMRWKAESLSPELRQRDLKSLAAESRARRAYDLVVERGGTLEDRRAASEALDEATDAVREVAGKIQRELKQQANLFYPRAKTLYDVQDALHEDQALVLYGLCLDEALALVLGRDGARIVSLGTVTDVVAACEALDATDKSVDPNARLDALRKLLVEPLKLSAGVKQVLLSPEGPLCYVPFGALFDQPVAMTPSGSTHVVLLGEERDPGRGILALGAPDYGGVSEGAQAIYYRGRTLSPLPATRKEVETIGTRTLLGPKASEAGLEAALPESKRWRSVHFACHGLVDIERPMRSSLVLSHAGDDDGFLTALEILRMKIPADLAVLSACETATGKIVRGEGIVGLTRAFMFAGAPRVICSLWKVDDEATKALMIKFYELWNPQAKPGDPERPKGVEGARHKGLGAAAALRQAQAFIRGHDKWKHPYYWAAWVLWGLPD